VSETINGQDIVDLLSAHAATDPAFAKALLADPQAAVEQLFNTSLPVNHKVVAVEQPANTWVVVVPTGGVVGEDGELSDADLEGVAGGAGVSARKFFKVAGDFLKENGSGTVFALGEIYGDGLMRTGARQLGRDLKRSVNKTVSKVC
jgi:hypothetical protein